MYLNVFWEVYMYFRFCSLQPALRAFQVAPVALLSGQDENGLAPVPSVPSASSRLPEDADVTSIARDSRQLTGSVTPTRGLPPQRTQENECVRHN